VLLPVSPRDNTSIWCARELTGKEPEPASTRPSATVRYEDVERGLRQNHVAIIRNAPRGPETTELENEIANLDEVVSVIADEARDIADELIREKSGVLRTRLREKEAELEAAQEHLRVLVKQREKLARPYVRQRLSVLSRALKRKPLNVTEVNKALKEVVSKIVLDPKAGRMTIPGITPTSQQTTCRSSQGTPGSSMTEATQPKGHQEREEKYSGRDTTAHRAKTTSTS
jgi:hypothetical protein